MRKVYGLIHEVYELIRSAHGLIRKLYELIRSAHGLIRKLYELIRSAHGLIRKLYELIRSAHGLIRKLYELTRSAHELFIKNQPFSSDNFAQALTARADASLIRQCSAISFGSAQAIFAIVSYTFIIRSARFAPIPSTDSSTEKNSSFDLSLRLKLFAKRWHSSRTNCKTFSASDRSEKTIGSFAFGSHISSFFFASPATAQSAPISSNTPFAAFACPMPPSTSIKSGSSVPSFIRRE